MSDIKQKDKLDYDKPVWRTGLWKRESKKGNTYLSGSTDKYWVNYFVNTRPDFESHGMLQLTEKDGDDNTPPIKISMYKRTSKKGTEYLAGKREYRFNIFTNSYKTNPKAPDYTLIVNNLVHGSVEVHEENSKPDMNFQPPEEEPVTDAEAEELPSDVDSDDLPF